MLQRISPSFDREERAVSSTYDFRVRFGFLLLLVAVETGQHSVAFSSSKTRHNAAVRLSVLLRLMDTSCGARMGLATVTTTAGEARTRLSLIYVCVYATSSTLSTILIPGMKVERRTRLALFGRYCQTAVSSGRARSCVCYGNSALAGGWVEVSGAAREASTCLA